MVAWFVLLTETSWCINPNIDKFKDSSFTARSPHVITYTITDWTRQYENLSSTIIEVKILSSITVSLTYIGTSHFPS